MKKLKVGMVGVGNFGAARRLLMREAGCFDIVACADRNADLLQRACSEENATPYNDFGALLADPAVEAVVVSTGATSHAYFAEQALLADKHVFVEKPLCCSLEEVSRLRRAAQASRRVVAVGHHQNDSDPIVILIRQMIENGSIGQVAAYEENTSHSGGFAIGETDWRGVPESNPGGMLFQCGVHAIHKLNAIFGPVAAVQAAFRYDVHLRTRTADVAACVLQHESGMLGTLNCYHVTAYCHQLRIFGTNGNLYIDTFEKRAWYQKALYGPREPQVEVPFPTPPDERTANLLSWYSAIVNGGEANPSLQDGINAVVPIFAAERAAKQQRLVRVKDLFDGAPEQPEQPAASGERFWVNPKVISKSAGVCP